jgi:hypothetical protein
MSCYGNSSFDRWLEGRADEHYGCNEDECDEEEQGEFYNVNGEEVIAESIEDAFDKTSLSNSDRPILKNGKRSKAKFSFFAPTENIGWIKCGRTTIGTIRLEE